MTDKQQPPSPEPVSKPPSTDHEKPNLTLVPPASDAPAEEPDGLPPQMQRPMHPKPGAKAKITIKRQGKEPVEIECSRNRFMILAHLQKELPLRGADEATLKAAQVTVVVPGETVPMAPDEEPEDVELVLAQGDGKLVYQQLLQQTLTAQEAVAEIQRLIAMLGEFSDMTCVILSVGFSTAGIGGVSMLNELMDITPQDIIMLASGAQGHVDQFKDKMRQNGVKFPDDSNIILPGQGGMPVTGDFLSKLRRGGSR